MTSTIKIYPVGRPVPLSPFDGTVEGDTGVLNNGSGVFEGNTVANMPASLVGVIVGINRIAEISVSCA